jgi:hypothetical protein
MKETIEQKVIQYAATQYAAKTLTELLTMAIAGDKLAAAEIVARQEKAQAEIESLKVKASKARTPKAEKTPLDLAKDNAYYRTALLLRQFGTKFVSMQTLTVASAYLGQGIAQGNLRQAFNRVSQVIKAQEVTEEVFPAWIVQAAVEIPVLDENKKLNEEEEKVEQIQAIISKYLDNEQTQEQAAQAAQEQAAQAAAPANKKGAKR